MAIGAATGTLAGAVRDFWVAGVGLDFVEEAEAQLQPGKVALVAEIEEEWVIPVDTALEAAGGRVFRSTRTEVAEAQFGHEIATLKSEIKALESETWHAGAAAKAKLQGKLVSAKSSLDAAVLRARKGVETLKRESDAKVEALTQQVSSTEGEVKLRIENRMKRVKSAYHARGAKLSQAWTLTREALAA
jgi:hypothetical protein